MVELISSADYRISDAKADSRRHVVVLTWSTGETTTADFSRYVGSGVFQAFLDPKFLDKVSIKRDGHVLAWPGNLDFSADDLWYDAHPEDIPSALRPYFPASTFRNPPSRNPPASKVRGA
jgi:hypothetical protein